MKSPVSRAHKEKKLSYRRREHKNKKFYNSQAWRDTREAYLRHYRQRLFRDIPNGKWDGMSLTAAQVTYIIAHPDLPCEICLKHYIAEAYDTVEKGVELDHIQAVNPENALDRIFVGVTAESCHDGILEGKMDYLFGDPFDFNNLQLLCKRHHAKKSQRER